MGQTISEPTIGMLFERQARTLGERPFLREKQGSKWRAHSWAEVANAAGRMRAGLLRLGLKPGDRIAIIAENCPQWVIVDQAGLGLGATTVPLYTTISAEETEFILSDSQAAVAAVYGEAAARKIVALGTRLKALKYIVQMQPADGGQQSASGSGSTPAVLPLSAFDGEQPAAQFEGGRDDLATIIYTSGTTGSPKGVMLTHGNILANCEASAAAINLTGSDELLSFLPLAHAFERTAGYYTPLSVGGVISYAQGLAQLAQNLREVRPTHFLTVPRLLDVVRDRVKRTVEEAPAYRRALFEAAMRVGRRAAEFRFRGEQPPAQIALAMALFRRLVFAKIHDLFGGRLRYLISGGAALSLDTFNFLAAAEIPIVEGYGLTEAGPVVSVNRHGRTRPGTVGLPLPNVEVALAPDGELLVRGPSVMKGYYKREEETREVLDADGWLHTGDLATIDAQGFITIRERKKDIIVLSGGKNISPVYLESKLTSDPFIAQACVVGDDRKHPGALLVPDFDALKSYVKELGLENAERTELVRNTEIRNFYSRRLREINRTLASHERIGAFCLIDQSFSQERDELTPTLKVRRKVIQLHYRTEIEAMFGAERAA
jgi:long-chain acyl-CoA synthetase